MRSKLLICDLDGTLVFTDEINFKAYSAALEAFGYGLTRDDYWEYCIGHSWKRFLPILAPTASADLMIAIHDQKKVFYQEFVEFGKLNGPLLELIKGLKSHYFTAIVTTASLKNTNDILQFFRLKEHFDFVITGDEVEMPKPKPEGFIAAANYFGVSPEDTIIFEDAPAGVEAALLFGGTVFQYVGRF